MPGAWARTHTGLWFLRGLGVSYSSSCGFSSCLPDGELKRQFSPTEPKRARWGFKRWRCQGRLEAIGRIAQRPEGWSDAGGCIVSSGRSHRSAADNSWSTLRLGVVLTATSADGKGATRGTGQTPQEKLLTSTLQAESPRLKATPRPEAKQEVASIWRDGSMGKCACFESMRMSSNPQHSHMKPAMASSAYNSSMEGGQGQESSLAHHLAQTVNFWFHDGPVTDSTVSQKAVVENIFFSGPCMCTYEHTCIHAPRHTCVDTEAHTCIHTYTQAHIYVHTTYTHAPHTHM